MTVIVSCEYCDKPRPQQVPVCPYCDPGIFIKIKKFFNSFWRQKQLGTPQYNLEKAGNERSRFATSPPAATTTINYPLIKPALQIDYTDISGVATKREISEIRYKNRYIFEAYCHLRKEKRTFYMGSVTRAVCIDTQVTVDEYKAQWGPNGRTRTIYFGIY